MAEPSLSAIPSTQAHPSATNPELDLNIRQKIALTSPRLRALLQRCISHWTACVSQAHLKDRQRVQRARHFVRHWHFRLLLDYANQQDSISWTNIHDLIRLGYRFFHTMSGVTLDSWEQMLLKQRDDYAATHHEPAQPGFIETPLGWNASAMLACVLAAYNASRWRRDGHGIALWLAFGEVVEEDMQLDYLVRMLGGDPNSNLGDLDDTMATDQDDMSIDEADHDLPALSDGAEESEADLQTPANEWSSSPSTSSQKTWASSMNVNITTPKTTTVKRSLVNRIKSLRL